MNPRELQGKCIQFITVGPPRKSATCSPADISTCITGRIDAVILSSNSSEHIRLCGEFVVEEEGGNSFIEHGFVRFNECEKNYTIISLEKFDCIRNNQNGSSDRYATKDYQKPRYVVRVRAASVNHQEIVVEIMDRQRDDSKKVDFIGPPGRIARFFGDTWEARVQRQSEAFQKWCDKQNRLIDEEGEARFQAERHRIAEMYGNHINI